MASKRKIRRKSCEGKIRHATAADAGYARHKLNQSNYTGHMNIYHCKFCKGWHIGHG